MEVLDSEVTNQPAPDTRHPILAIEFQNVTKRFASASDPAVDNVSLKVEQGNIVVLLGPSGCGKTTLLKMVNRLYEHDSGRILFEGQEIRSFKATDLRRRIGYVIQSTGLFPHMTVARNIATVPQMLHWDKARIARRTDELLELVGLSPTEYRKRYPQQLSGGQQQRVGLARALAADPSIMLMDEPFAAIDNITRRRLQDELINIQSKVRKTILFVTHDVEEAIRLADKIAVMERGRVVQYDTPLNILSAPASAFVASLVGSEDVLRRLSLLSVRTAMQPIQEGSNVSGGPTIAVTVTLRDALGLLLSKDADRLTIVDPEGAPVGTIDIASIKQAMEQ
jgi:osmoprotectant transport system ATP-binding protein